MQTPSAPKIKHSVLEDVQGLALGIFLCGLGMHFLTNAGLITGQTAGLAVIASYLTGWSFGVMFFVINLPFYILAYVRLGPIFTIKSLISVTGLSLVTELLPYGFTIDHLEPWMAALIAGALIGPGLLAMFRHNGSLGGFGVLALIVQDRFSFKAGYVQLIADALIFAGSLFLFPAKIVGWSLLGAVILNLIITVNHRRDRYIAT
ncbi:YitT family protein [Flavimaricola marinus]|uniref:5xTM membrane BCR, YitT family n=1 Tax=Flavimaricola marinus TaxID=1819565 RepID=A0A238LD05_9RHOB|nr:YitT family protein [Flavimaricola marinus]SMY07607.1 hypothetical protein LOM8899_01744 [Flavimaricola marinus]